MSLVYNELKISGTNNELLKKFYNDNKVIKEDIIINNTLFPKETKLSFEKCVSTSIIPLLQKKYIENNYDLENEKKYNISNCDDLKIFLWGTASNAYNIDIEMDENIFLYTFNTKIRPPINWFYAISQKYVSLKFEVNISYENNNNIMTNLIFEKGNLISNKKINIIDDFYNKYGGVNNIFNKIKAYMKSKNIDYKKYIKRIYETHYKECDNDTEKVDYDGVLEEFIEKVKIGKFLNKLFENNDTLLYFYAKELVNYLKN